MIIVSDGIITFLIWDTKITNIFLINPAFYVWLTLKWNDCQFGWDPHDYHGVNSIHVPSERLWSPDIVLFNNAGCYKIDFYYTPNTR
jgi:hypothetical protein